MSPESPVRLPWAFAFIAAAAIAMLLVEVAWERFAIVLVAGVAAALIARGRDQAEPSPAPSPSPSPRLDEVLDAVVDPVLVLENGRVALANRAARALLGAHVVGEDARIAIRHPAAADAIAAATGEVIELVGIGARDRRWEFRVAPTSAGQKLVTLHDRTENVQAEKMRVDFVANASHELRTPLTSIIGYVETLMEDAGDEPVLRHRFLKIMMDEARRMQRLVEDLLSLSRIEGDKFRAPDRSVDLATLVVEVCAELRSSGNPRAGDICCETEDDLPPVAGDQAQLSQLLHNIIGNAMKYGRPATPVVVCLARSNGGVRLTVEDQSEGIAAEHLPRLTERFYRVDAGRSRSLGGTGLGLAIVKHVVERHRGRFELASRVGVGSTATVTLPAAPAASPPEPAVIKG